MNPYVFFLQPMFHYLNFISVGFLSLRAFMQPGTDLLTALASANASFAIKNLLLGSKVNVMTLIRCKIMFLIFFYLDFIRYFYVTVISLCFAEVKFRVKFLFSIVSVCFLMLI